MAKETEQDTSLRHRVGRRLYHEGGVNLRIGQRDATWGDLTLASLYGLFTVGLAGSMGFGLSFDGSNLAKNWEIIKQAWEKQNTHPDKLEDFITAARGTVIEASLGIVANEVKTHADLLRALIEHKPLPIPWDQKVLLAASALAPASFFGAFGAVIINNHAHFLDRPIAPGRLPLSSLQSSWGRFQQRLGSAIAGVNFSRSSAS